MIRSALGGERCVGSGARKAPAREVSQVGDDGVVAVLRPEAVAGDLPDVEAAVRTCPSPALALASEQRAGAAG